MPPHPYSKGKPHVDSFSCHLTLQSSAVGLGIHQMTQAQVLSEVSTWPRGKLARLSHPNPGEQVPPTRSLLFPWAMRGSPNYFSLWNFSRKVRHQLLYFLKPQGHRSGSPINHQLENGLSVTIVKYKVVIQVGGSQESLPRGSDSGSALKAQQETVRL